jgi:hypothetical protein
MQASLDIYVSKAFQWYKEIFNLVTTFPLIILFVINHGGYIQMSFCPMTPNLEVLKFSKLGLLAFWKAITSCANLQLGWF